ncbi:hypothetical protein NQ318_018679 [Aromia moschata]|uniref:Carboxylic ester hydrolase n=1 Tax=Aromia moschata TaxID=1265417 RepID=A0AAV8ZHI1_9CUCU|nr:hypothetical protein NQ318_018679 [Aromia moschata]
MFAHALLCALFSGSMLVNCDVIAELPQGTVQGTYKTSYGGKNYSAFEGIPYAKPPVDKLRFEEPQPAEKWNGVLVADKSYVCTSFIPFPMVRGVMGTEDCLYVYVYVPRMKISKEENLDVVVHIHGGAFMLGAPMYMADPTFIMDQNVVYVSFNYRLGVLGFLSTEDDVVPGNNGLKDQSLALKWIKDNIKYFGGNPNSITLTGLSAGAASVHYHYLSPWSKGLFHRGFSQSGTSLQHWALVEEPLLKAQTVARNLSCTIESTRPMVDCLKKIDAEDLVMGILPLFVFIDSVPFTTFGPVVEKGSNPFPARPALQIAQGGKVQDVPWVVSNVKDEGLMPAGLFMMMKKLEELNRRWDEIMPYALDINSTVDDNDKKDVITKVRKYYFKEESLSPDNLDSLAELFSDRGFLVDAEKAIRAHSKAVKSPVYYYLFNYVLQIPAMFKGTKKGVAHSDDGRILFKIFGTPSKLPKDDEKNDETSDWIYNFLCIFKVSRDIVSKPKMNGVEWKPVDPASEEIDYLNILSPDDISMGKIKELAHNSFWNSLPIKENDKIL